MLLSTIPTSSSGKRDMRCRGLAYITTAMLLSLQFGDACGTYKCHPNRHVDSLDRLGTMVLILEHSHIGARSVFFFEGIYLNTYNEVNWKNEGREPSLHQALSNGVGLHTTETYEHVGRVRCLKRALSVIEFSRRALRGESVTCCAPCRMKQDHHCRGSAPELETACTSYPATNNYESLIVNSLLLGRLSLRDSVQSSKTFCDEARLLIRRDTEEPLVPGNPCIAIQNGILRMWLVGDGIWQRGKETPSDNGACCLYLVHGSLMLNQFFTDNALTGLIPARRIVLEMCAFELSVSKWVRKINMPISIEGRKKRVRRTNKALVEFRRDRHKFSYRLTFPGTYVALRLNRDSCLSREDCRHCSYSVVGTCPERSDKSSLCRCVSDYPETNDKSLMLLLKSATWKSERASDTSAQNAYTLLERARLASLFKSASKIWRKELVLAVLMLLFVPLVTFKLASRILFVKLRVLQDRKEATTDRGSSFLGSVQRDLHLGRHWHWSVSCAISTLMLSTVAVSGTETMDLRENITRGLEPCFHYIPEMRLFYMNCTVLNWKEYEYKADTHISLGANETFDGDTLSGDEYSSKDNGEPASVIDLYDIVDFKGLFRIKHEDVFAFSDAPLIKNVHIRNGKTAERGGFIVREKQKHFIVDSCSSTGDITKERAGGICGSKCGHDNGQVKISKSYSKGAITDTRAGGITGALVGFKGGLVHITQCHSTGNIEERHAGGICGSGAGHTGGAVYVRQSYSTGDILSSAEDSGGIVGSQAGTKGYIHIHQCYTTGRILAENSGGIAGAYASAFSGEMHIIDCYTRGDINGKWSAGGITARQTGGGGAGFGDVYIQNTYASGSINGENAGGIVGHIDSGFHSHTVQVRHSVYNGNPIIGTDFSYSDLDQTDNSGNLNDIRGQLYSQWDDDSWAIPGTDQLPILRFQLPSPRPSPTSSSRGTSTPTPTTSTTASLSATTTATSTVTTTETPPKSPTTSPSSSSTRTPSPSPSSSITSSPSISSSVSSTGTKSPSRSSTTSSSSSPSPSTSSSSSSSSVSSTTASIPTATPSKSPRTRVKTKENLPVQRPPRYVHSKKVNQKRKHLV